MPALRPTAGRGRASLLHAFRADSRARGAAALSHEPNSVAGPDVGRGEPEVRLATGSTCDPGVLWGSGARQV